MEANFENPLRTKQAIKLYMCEECKAGGDCGWDCVESRTCSTRCRHCGERVWFGGDFPRHADTRQYVCPYCGGTSSVR